ncbi:protein phosphatase 2C domain-containing protein [Anaeromyxobacter diazotrophicus]|uniref:Protein-serine/threonine phosphatase n=1 Tax=Anaeromyxobacter diazotrophicus TaxID=2590199 RepID=A0A7I9VKA7_9BACT|nr:PP2C family serine/threonine-protein phosphatase [Anaeromyxobacter diazotrophicus]GEJ56846.1 protein-serine/threonine phosphatase [Anaeromyxobacter diazotrophicus]
MRLTAAGDSHVGLRRAHNEDAFLLLLEERLLCVADGMGGHASGEVAARVAVEEMAEFFSLTGRDEEATWPFPEDPRRGEHENRLIAGVKLANQRIRQRARADERLRGMGTTLVTAWFSDRAPEALVAHVGDSRAYLYRRGVLAQLTEDHSLLNDFIRVHRPSAAEIDAFPHKNVIVRALGMRDDLEVDLLRVPLEEGDEVLLCCDGLSGMVPDARIAEILRGARADLPRAVQGLIAAANEAGGIDNITCVLAQVHR